MSAIGGWLASLGLDSYSEIFQNAEIDIDVVSDLTEADLKELGLPIGARKKILRAAKAAVTNNADIAIFQPLSEEQRYLTALKCDLASGEGDPAATVGQAAKSEFLKYCRDIIEGAGGRVCHHSGAGMLAFFGHPIPKPTDAARAVRTAMEIYETAALQDLPDGVCALAGVDTGEVTVGYDRSGALMAVGDTMNFAARLIQFGGPGAVAVSERTYQLIKEQFSFSNGGKRQLKGFGLQKVWLAARSASGQGFRGAGSGELIGRATELSALRKSWAKVLQGQAQTVLINGPPGAGKSRLLRQFSAELPPSAANCITFCATVECADSPFHPFAQWVQRLCGLSKDMTEPEQREALAQTLDQHGAAAPKGALSALRAVLYAQDARSDCAHDPHRTKQQFFATVQALMAAMTKNRPVWLNVENAHWLDPSSLQLLERLVEQSDAAPLFVTITSEAPFSPTMRQAANVRLLSLDHFDAKRTDALLADLNGGRPLPQRLAQQIEGVSNGAPLLIKELTRAAIETDQATNADGAPAPRGGKAGRRAPSSLKSALVARLAQVSGGLRAVQLASVLGRRFSHQMLLSLAGADQQASQTAAALAQLVEMDIVRATSAPPECDYVFRHPLLRNAAYETLQKRDKRGLHKKAAALVQQHMGDAHPELIAWHFHIAGDYRRAAPLWKRAGENAMAIAADAEAVKLYESALEAVTFAASDGGGLEQKIELRLAQCNALASAGHFDRAARVLVEAETLAENLNDEYLMVAVGARVCYVECQRSALDAAIRSGEQAMEQAQRLLDPELMVACAYVLGESLQYSGRARQARQVQEDALRYLRGDLLERSFGPTKATAVDFFMTLSLSCVLLGDFTAAEEYGEKAREIADKSGRDYAIGSAQYGLAVLNLDRGRLEQGRQHLSVAMEKWRQDDAGYLLPIAAAELGVYCAHTNQLDRAVDLLSEVIDEANRSTGVFYSCLAEAYMAVAYLTADQPEKAAPYARNALAVAEYHDFTYQSIVALRALGSALCPVGDIADGVKHLKQAITLADKYELGPQIAISRYRLGQAYADADLPDLARNELIQAVKYLEEKGMTLWLEPAKELLSALVVTPFRRRTGAPSY